jgi:lipopolysaccharide transport system ATP-binding protein
MSDVVISVENLSKRYLVGHRLGERGRYTALRDVIAREARNFIRKAVDAFRGRQIVQGDEVEEFWALKDVSFNVKRGEVIGIIGKNGAGKSTLLKILSRITEPTAGRVRLRGRVASLLEVGTGFHPELTGRENIFLNGAILGMSRREIRSKFDQIVAFAEVEKFLDTPVKHYSSGMYVRLAFAVAAHLEPEILLVDEVLAVGDAEFQKKCLGKLESVTRHGRTVVFVSHNIDAIERITSSCIYLSEGGILLKGSTRQVVDRYLLSENIPQVDVKKYRATSIPNTAAVQDLWIENASRQRVTTLRQGEPFRVILKIAIESVPECDLAVVFESSRETPIFTSHLSDLGKPISGTGIHYFAVDITKPNFRSGDYLVSLAAFSLNRRVYYDVSLHIPAFRVSGVMKEDFPNDERWGCLYVPIKWASVQ